MQSMYSNNLHVTEIFTYSSGASTVKVDIICGISISKLLLQKFNCNKDRWFY